MVLPLDSPLASGFPDRMQKAYLLLLASGSAEELVTASLQRPRYRPCPSHRRCLAVPPRRTGWKRYEQPHYLRHCGYW